ncbi:hypothetical protein RUM44_013875 [Polyplax serrata]|uniref:SURP motif domain-containing protein n=1 Tax=Polyplax serrata TaxID=468196 RepID=A0ABR1BJ08_POLSC
MASRLKEDITINKNNETDELLVFGYSCKLFRDDEKALYIDQGKHLIPWMGDETLKIDRYDARGTLFDLKQAEAPSGGFDRYFGLTDMERQVESMCDDERYRALVTNEEEETMYQEEELKRLHYAISDKGNSYGQVEYKYDGESNTIEESNNEKNIEKQEDCGGGDDEPFVPSPQLDIPVNMVLPETVKHNAIIEKTAMFINNQGPQMEILLKMKQAGNPQFNFLSFDNPLHSYYRHLLMVIKGGQYKGNMFDSTNKKSDMEYDEDDHYLHPSLAPSVSKVELAPSIPSINYRPSAHCAYSMLVNKIKDKKVNEQGTQLSRLKEALERLKDSNGSEENGETNESSGYQQYDSTQYSTGRSVVVPPNEMQTIIDKMASYVAKNGRDFEAVVQMKNDPRFNFLNSTHIYNVYYQQKLKQYENLEKSSKQNIKSAHVKSDCTTLKLKDDPKNKVTPVCFSIKKPKDSEPVIEKSALPIEESSDEESKKERDCYEETEKDVVKEEIVTIDLAAQEEKEEKNKKILGKYNRKTAERLKDKLSAAAREKVALASKEKQLQLERKRRAAAFLKAIHTETESKGAVMCGPQLPTAEEPHRDTDDGSDVASLPDTSEAWTEERSKRGKLVDRHHHHHSRYKSNRHENEKRHHSSSVRHKHREKHRSKGDRQEKVNTGDEPRLKELTDRITESSPSSQDDQDEDRRSGFHGYKYRKSDDNQWKTKYNRDDRSFRKEERRHKRKKHKADTAKDRGYRNHSKIKKHKRNRGSDDSRHSRSKRSRRNSSFSVSSYSSNSDDQNS